MSIALAEIKVSNAEYFILHASIQLNSIYASKQNKQAGANKQS